MIAVLFPLIAGIPAFGQALLPTQGVVDDVVYTVLDGPGGSLFPDVFYITPQSSDAQVAAFRVTTEFRDGRKDHPDRCVPHSDLGALEGCRPSYGLKLLKTASIHQIR